MRALVLAAGKGERLRPLTYATPKPLLPIGGKPIIHRILEWLEDYGLEPAVAVSYLGNRVRTYLQKTFPEVEVVRVAGWETWGDLKLAALHLDLSEPFLVVYADVLTDYELSLLLTESPSEALVTLGVVRVEREEAKRLGVVKLHGKWVEEFVEKPSDPPSTLVHAGFYVVQPALLQEPIKKAKLENFLFPKLVRERHLAGVEAPVSYWFDIGTIPSYLRANAYFYR